MTVSVRVGGTWTTAGIVGGRWLHGLAPYGELEYTTALRRCTDSGGGGGVLTISWVMATSVNTSLPSVLRQGQLVELFAGAQKLGAGFISETPAGDSVVCDGLFRLGENFLAVSGTAPTTNVRTAVQAALLRGLPWRDPGTLPNVSISTLSETEANFNTISALLNQYCLLAGKVWWIDRYSVLRIEDLPTVGSTSPRWVLSPSVPSMETADDDYRSTLFLRRVDGVDGDGQPNAWAGEQVTDATAPIVREDSFDLEQLGYLSSPSAIAAGQEILDANKARSGFTEGVSLARAQITNSGGVSPEPWQVSAVDPCVIRDPNWVNSSGVVKIGRAMDWVVGGTRFKQGEPLTVTPLELAARTQARVIQDATPQPKLVFK